MENAVAAEKDGVVKEVRVQRRRLGRRRRRRGGHRVGDVRDPRCRRRSLVSQGRGSRGRRPPPRRTRLAQPPPPRHARAVLRGDRSPPGRWPRRMRAGGLEVDEGVYDLPTALESRTGEGELVVAVCAEYDALPDVGHACGHNIIAATAVGAGLALAAVADDARAQRAGARHAGRGGRRGQGPDARARRLRRRPRRHDGPPLAVGTADRALPGGGALRRPLTRARGARVGRALGGCRTRRTPSPWPRSPSASLRQQLPPGDQVHGVVTESIGAANVIPASVTARYMVRSRTARGPGRAPAPGGCVLRGRALATGCSVDVRGALARVLAHGGQTPRCCGAYRANAEALGRRFDADDAGAPAADVLHRHGQRVAGGAHHPPAHRHRDATAP